MKTRNFFLIALFSSLVQISYSQSQNFYGTTLVGVNIETYDTTGLMLFADTADVHCVWRANEDYTNLHYTEYLANGTVFRTINFTILNRNENEDVRRLVVQNDANIFAMLFWKDGSMVAYEMRDEVMLLTGQVEY